ncbi:CMRF35-like molecule 5 isoform X2 [Neoarius graeffei]|uniref:CMRF35-like molecule 5 isoform X2 n=1 Tax=Neoarius graeffei TaxID=443677 RepID=UPI00298D5F2C|nr:CMRF35-like molecule 5 isoform X2 [Neoarius graeffei]
MKILLIFTFCLMIADDTDAVTTITGYRGRSVQIQCPYQPGYEEYKKYLCRGKCPILGDKDIPVESGSPAKDPRFSLYDNTTAKIFTVTITDLRPEDKGTYWCAIERTVADIYTESRLLVKTADPAISTVSQSTHSTSTHAMSPSVHAEIPHSTDLPDLPDLPVSTVIIAVSVVFVLLLIALLFAVILQKKKKIQASSPVRSPQSSSDLHVVPCPVYDYEEIKDSWCLSNDLYSTAQLPSNPTEIYSNTGLPTASSDYTQTLYSTVQHPSDSADQGDYSTANLPTTLSDSSVSAAPPSAAKPPESPTYTTMRFDTSSVGAAPAVIYKNENSSCIYSTVDKNKGD